MINKKLIEEKMKDKIEVKYDINPYMNGEFLNIFINGESIEKLCNTTGLIPSFLHLMDEDEEEQVWDMLESDSDEVSVLPILICSEDLDLSCSVVVVEVQKLENSVKWLRMGYGELGWIDESSLISSVPSFEFTHEEYDRCIRAFKWQRDVRLGRKALSFYVKQLFTLGELAVYETYSEPDQELKVLRTAEEFDAYIDINLEKKVDLLQFQLLYKEMEGDLWVRKYSLSPEHCDGHTFRYETIGLGAIGLSLNLYKSNLGIGCHVYGTNKEESRKKSEDYRYKNSLWGTWNWEVVEEKLEKLKDALSQIKEEARVSIMERKANNEVVMLIESHGYKAKIVDDNIISNFKENVLLGAWVYPQKFLDGIQSRFDVGVKFENDIELFESFSDFGKNENEALAKNIENFSRSSLPVFLDAFNDTEVYTEKERWQVNSLSWDVFIGDYNIKSSKGKSVEVPTNLFDEIEEIIAKEALTDEFYFVRFFYAQHNNKTAAIEFMINNVNIETAEDRLINLDWMRLESFYSLRSFLILKVCS
ncbi:MAG: Unknown protein [uncultured Sulfurovum sp.]|uniref:Uncharacterized protein n=1 Tax=uncultured Sulfurovum sp. TaxID=269237 RepID=A0A6S6S1W4_9BACT|nr:MAG: Unknown protein [uncultured Sulfurovum sp.]